MTTSAISDRHRLARRLVALAGLIIAAVVAVGNGWGPRWRRGAS